MLFPATGRAFLYDLTREVNRVPSENVLKEKQEVVASIKESLSSAVAGVLVNYQGINVADDTKLRKELREAGVKYTVVKNTLLRRAAEDVGYGELSSVLEGTTALAVSENDPVAAAKILNKFAESSNGMFTLKAGFVEGKILDQAGINELAKLPGKEQLLAMLLSALNGNVRGLAVALNAIAEKQEEVA